MGGSAGARNGGGAGWILVAMTAANARDASVHGYELTFPAVTVVALVGLPAVTWLVRRPPTS